VTSIAPANPIIAEPNIKINKCCLTTFLPMALAASSLSLIALIILPQGEFKAFSEKYRITNTTTKKIKLKQNPTKTPEEEITN
jgi:hypothetical protein